MLMVTFIQAIRTTNPYLALCMILQDHAEKAIKITCLILSL